ncbi:DNA-directed RNA polymerase subunit beta [Desulfurobacterium pacificum]|uniref:DNA-directed RNA polymerase subunit beta n=1 Tax=Desulfurobacterium pacificum TaxID=240166 RepID=A0ABY1NM20_9BACT|nr:DNA-directed RNA polymerase subunit beta [Desulfurobacterium pacificum]SMP13315.1 DNA-directed RNA polymerase subunit beta [Desulfurobacterium pacificum]
MGKVKKTAPSKEKISIKSLPRKSFAKREEKFPIPDLLQFPFESYERFLQLNKAPHERENVGLESAFRQAFPIVDEATGVEIHYKGYEIGDWYCKCGRFQGLGGKGVVCPKCGMEVVFRPKYSPDECKERGIDYSAPLRVLFELHVWQKDPKTGGKIAPIIKENKMYFGEVPLMTERGTFIINGTEKVVVSQLHRSPGLFFKNEVSKTTQVARIIDIASIIPAMGSWLEFEIPHNEVLYAKIDRKRRFIGTYLLRAFGIRTDEEILDIFYGDKIETFRVENGEIVNVETGEVKSQEELTGYYLVSDIIDPETGEVIQEAYEELSTSSRKLPEGAEFKAINKKSTPYGAVIVNTLRKEKRDRVREKIEDPLIAAYVEIFRKVRPGDTATVEGAKKLFESMFFSTKNYDLSRVGRAKINEKVYPKEKLEKITKEDLKNIDWLPPLRVAKDICNEEGDIVVPAGTLINAETALKLSALPNVEEIPVEPDYDDAGRILHKADIVGAIKALLEVHAGIREYDDIDHLGNRRVRGVGELAEIAFKSGLFKLEKAVKEKLAVADIDSVMPQDLINPRTALNPLKEFFTLTSLCQFMDQTNPLAETTHKRRLSALGPGGLTRERAGFEVRDVHPSHYGRICPIETPEGQNIGLINSLTTYGRINWLGFLETPYRKVVDGKVTDEIVYMTADEEENYVIAQANAPLDENGYIAADTVMARHKAEFKLVRREEVQFMDVSPKQVFSVSASLIPFLEHDDANRALMGSNMQRQAVPLIKTEAPFIGTGMEEEVALYSRSAVVAKRSGVVESVTADKIIVRVDPEEIEEGGISVDTGFDVYELKKFQKSNQKTCINQRPIVRKGDRVKRGQIIADGPSMDNGELALGKNVLVAFMPWRGYNFEDAILVSERLLKDDVYTSIHIQEFECEAVETKLGREEITRDIPNVPESLLRNLDESGIVRIGTYVKPGDILVGKVTPKGEQVLTPEEKLLQAIFGEKAKGVKDSSLYVPHGVEGVVIDVKILSRKGEKKDPRTQLIEAEEKAKLEREKQEEIALIKKDRDRKAAEVILGKRVKEDVRDASGNLLISAGEEITEDNVEQLVFFALRKPSIIDDDKVAEELKKIRLKAVDKIALIENIYEEKKAALEMGHDLPAGVNKKVKVYIATKRKLTIGDKMSGRHGNKGVISQIRPVEDMPFLEDGTPVDIVLNPLGVPSRMNVGQILEVHLGLAAKELGKKIERLMKAGLDKVREEIKAIYNDERISKLIDSLSDDELREVAKKLSKGIKFESPIFNGAKEEEIKELLRRAGLPETGQLTVYDGLTGEPFDQNVTVGYMYMLKLIHLADDKIHARSTGPYSLITQQPLGGKAQFGGQRFGEMEVWALEAYGAAYTLQEMLTVKSDDVEGRSRVYEAIVKGKYSFEPGLPESFNVLVRELKALALDVRFIKEMEEEEGTEN